MDSQFESNSKQQITITKSKIEIKEDKNKLKLMKHWFKSQYVLFVVDFEHRFSLKYNKRII